MSSKFEVLQGTRSWLLTSAGQFAITNIAMRLIHSSHKEKDLAVSNRENAGPVSQSIAQLKELYLKATNEAQQGSIAAAIETCETALPIISSTTTNLITSSELRKWTELLLTRFCILSSHAIQNNNSAWLEAETLAAFRAWADFWERQPGVTPNNAIGGKVEDADVSRRVVWKEYYTTISYILQNDLPYPTTIMATTYNDHALRLVQKSELTRVGHKYESLLLAEVQFPKAEQHNEEVEEWVDMVVRNWKILCGSGWDELALGAGGRAVLSRNVLDILYRAATKTFHSTHILRQLFTVHLAVADFDLAFKAFETYFDIAKKAKQRVEKTGMDEPGLDTDENVLQTVAQCISALCRFGGLAAAEKARELARYLESWFETHDPFHPSTVNIEGITQEKRVINGEIDVAHQIAPKVIVQAWRSVGIAYAQWARLTYDAKSRSPYQLKAIESLRKALHPAHGQEDDIDTLFALAIVLAERRQIGEAIRAVGAALQPSSDSTSSPYADGYSGRYARERSLIPLWHLLALLLSAKEEFPEASRACEGAFKQFGDLDVLFGDVDATYQSEHLQGLQEKTTLNAVIDDMDDFEKETVLEVKITQLILAEVQDGPEDAINGTEELLSLYTRLFGDPQTSLVSRPKTVEQGPPQTGTGTLKSVKGSIFKRKNRDTSTATSNDTVRPETSQVTAPKIQVTGENGNHKHRHHGIHLPHSQKADNLLRKKSQSSMNHRNTSAALRQQQQQQQQHVDGTREVGGPPSQHVSDLDNFTHSSVRQVAAPPVRFPTEQARRHKVGILVKVWLLIAGFYRRAEMYDDAKMAIDAAYELVDSVEADILKDTTGNLHVDEPGWGVGKCVEEMWGDVWAEVSH